jgi:hypothetical protein
MHTGAATSQDVIDTGKCSTFGAAAHRSRCTIEPQPLLGKRVYGNWRASTATPLSSPAPGCGRSFADAGLPD